MNYNNQKIVKRIAEIEGLEVEECEGELLYWPTNYAETYDPINNAGQAMELLKGLRKGCVECMGNGEWIASSWVSGKLISLDVLVSTPELAICLAYLASMGEDLTQFEEC